MANHQTSCTYDGDTFIGTFAESGRGNEATVTVHYGRTERTAALRGTSAASAAQRILSDLVRDRLSEEARLTV